MKILFVCTDNFTRSVTAELCFKHYLVENNINSIEVASAGVRANSDITKYSSLHFDRMKELNIDTSSFTRTPFERRFFNDYDFVVAMGKEHKDYLYETYGQKTYLFNEIWLGEETSFTVPPPDGEGKYLIEIRAMVDYLHASMPLFLKRVKELHLKQKLRDLDLSNNTLILDDMLEHIGSTDAELRDTLIYTSFAKLISDNHLTKDQMTQALTTCVSRDYLFHKIGEVHDDSVLQRSFSSLVIALILNKDRERPFLSTDTVNEVINLSIQYMHQERDVRGYVEGKGWAHAIAHGADLLDAAISHSSFSLQLSQEVLDSIGKCLLCGEVYIDDEDERLVAPIVSLLNRGLSTELVVGWLSNLYESTQEGIDLIHFRRRTNLYHFMKTLYFCLLSKELGKDIKIHIEKLMKNKENAVITS